MTDQDVASNLSWHGLSFMEKKSLSGDGRRLWYAQSRDIDRDGKPTIVFLHGVLRDWRSFYPLLTALNEEANLVSIDFRGHGQSDSASEYRVMNYVDDAVRLVNELEGQVHLYGHSLGAMVALATAARVPERIKTTILEDPPFATMGRRLDGSPLMHYFRSVETVVRNELKSAETRLDKSSLQSRIERLFDAFSNITVGTDANGKVVRLRDQRDEISRRFSAESLASIDPEVLAPITSGQWLEGYALEEFSALVKSKVVILRADATCGGMLMKEDADLIVKHAPDRCKELFFPGVGHSMHWAQPREIADLVRRQL